MADTKDARVRTRMVDDCRKEADMFASELLHYKHEFGVGEVQALRDVIRDLRKLADRIEKNDALNTATVT